MNAAAAIRTARTEAGLSLRELAARAKTSHSTIAAYESGTKRPNVSTLNRILDAAGFAFDLRLERRQRGTHGLSRGDELVAVLELAAAFPARHSKHLDCPVFQRAS